MSYRAFLTTSRMTGNRSQARGYSPRPSGACNVEEKWQSNKAFPTTNMRMLDDEILCDVTFLVGEKSQQMKAHKFILASRSPVFHAMFCGPLAESGDAIRIPDIEVDEFKHLLWYLYTGECPVTPELVMALLYAANKYEVSGLTSECRKYLETNMAPNNVCTILQQAHTFDDQTLIKTCTEFVEMNGTASIKSEGFTSLSKPLLTLIVQSDALSAEEEDVYSACVNWAKETCKKTGRNPTDANCRAALGDVVELIRFPLMSLETFTSLVSKQAILTSEEKVCLFQHYGSGNQQGNRNQRAPRGNIATKNVGQFSCKERNPRMAQNVRGYSVSNYKYYHADPYPNYANSECLEEDMEEAIPLQYHP